MNQVFFMLILQILFQNTLKPYGRQGISVNIVTRLRAGRLDFDSLQGQIWFLFSVFRPPPGYTQPPIQLVPRV